MMNMRILEMRNINKKLNKLIYFITLNYILLQNNNKYINYIYHILKTYLKIDIYNEYFLNHRYYKIHLIKR